MAIITYAWARHSAAERSRMRQQQLASTSQRCRKRKVSLPRVQFLEAEESGDGQQADKAKA